MLENSAGYGRHLLLCMNFFQCTAHCRTECCAFLTVVLSSFNLQVGKQIKKLRYLPTITHSAIIIRRRSTSFQTYLQTSRDIASGERLLMQRYTESITEDEEEEEEGEVDEDEEELKVER